MLVLTEDALLLCKHALGKVTPAASQAWVTVEGRRVLIRPDPEARPIAGCPNVGVAIVPCTLTGAVRTGYSTWIRIDGAPLCLDTVTGLTNGSPPGTVEYGVSAPGQSFVSEGA